MPNNYNPIYNEYSHCFGVLFSSTADNNNAFEVLRLQD